MMRKLGKEREQELIGVMNVVTQQVEKGKDPTDALLKTAQDRDLSDDTIRLLGRMYNTGRTLAQIKEGSMEDKLKEFPLADSESVIEKLARAQPTTPQEIRRVTSVSQVYDLAVPEWATEEPSNKKEAFDLAAAYRELDAAQGRKTVARTVVEESDRYDRMRMVQKQASDLKGKVTIATTKMASALDSLTRYFDHNRNVSPADVDAAIDIAFGKEGCAVMEYVAASLPTSYFKAPKGADGFDLKKVAASQRDQRINWRQDAKPLYVNWDAEPFVSIENCVELCKRARLIYRDWKAADHTAKTSTGDVLGAIRKRHSQPGIFDDILGQEKEAKGPMGYAVAGGVGSMTSQFFGDEKERGDKRLSRLVDELSDNDEELAKIRTHTMLSNLMESDDVLRGYEPPAIANAFNMLTDMAPHAMGQPLMAQSLLRKQLAQESMDPFDAEQLVKIDRRLREPTGKDPHKDPHED